ncbi:hypothetical protein SteCoe_8851 [Stentor coeruleus]|uniref:FYVE-type domain-containing protein n=1 Tax=Stentor coeruleus TaxID=5963 RepID=A0A1R2CJ22_9CILI|nr:hypothetical protein SteCoe_8851 [Stentor coeruleus]
MQVSRSDSVSSVSSVSSLNGFPKSPFGVGEKKDLEWKLDNKCFICQKKFGLGARHHCRYCGNSVCGKHSFVKMLTDSTEKTRICENCDIEIIKDEIRSEIQEELAKIQDNIDITKENYEKLDQERQEQTKIATGIEEDMLSAEKDFREKEQNLVNKLNEEQNKGQKSHEITEQIQRALAESNENEKKTNSICGELESKIEKLKNEILNIRTNNTELKTHLENSKKKLIGSLSAEKIANSLCDMCKLRVIRPA